MQLFTLITMPEWSILFSLFLGCLEGWQCKIKVDKPYASGAKTGNFASRLKQFWEYFISMSVDVYVFASIIAAGIYCKYLETEILGDCSSQLNGQFVL